MFVDQVLVLEIYSSLVYRFYVAGEVPGTAPLVDTLATADHANCAIEGVGENLKHALPFPGMVVHASFAVQHGPVCFLTSGQ